MLKVISVVDKKGTALDRLATQVIPYHDNIEYVICDIHPKRPDPQQLAVFEKEMGNADIIDFQYFRTAELLLGMYPELQDKKLTLTHNNPYSYKDSKWEWADANIGNNNEITAGLKAQGSPNVHHIPITIDVDFWKFNDNWEANKTVIMVANRIEAKKGILEAATAVGNLGLKFVLVGAISDRNYFNEILQTGTVEFHEQISDEKLRELYHKSALLVCNSIDNFESGTMPILEAMACGTPVLTRKIGHVPDFYNEHNLYINPNPSNEIYLLQKEIENILNDKKKMAEVRQEAWHTVRNYNNERRAYSYQKLWRSLYREKPVSIILPVCENQAATRKNIMAIANSNYKNIELIIIDDGEEMQVELISELKFLLNCPVRYIYNYENDYGLARARNKGIIEATGDLIVFLDQRMIVEPYAISELVNNVAERKWVYGNKNGKKDFVENFSCIYRDDIIRAGMFNERINHYGGMSQEVRSRTRMQGIQHVYIESAKAVPEGKSRNKWQRRYEIMQMKNKLFKMGL